MLSSFPRLLRRLQRVMPCRRCRRGSKHKSLHLWVNIRYHVKYKTIIRNLYTNRRGGFAIIPGLYLLFHHSTWTFLFLSFAIDLPVTKLPRSMRVKTCSSILCCHCLCSISIQTSNGQFTHPIPDRRSTIAKAYCLFSLRS